MAGDGYYSAHSGVQRVAAAPGYPLFERAAAEAPLPSGGETLTIGDFGCAGGANEMAPLTIGIQRLRHRRGDLPIEVVHADLPANDFASLFALVETSPSSYAWERTGIYSYAAGRSLYGPVLPDRRLHLGWTAITVHWLSTVPNAGPTPCFRISSPATPAPRSRNGHATTGTRSSPSGPANWFRAASSSWSAMRPLVTG